MSIKHTVFIGLGSNLNQPVLQLESALKAMTNHPQIVLQSVSRFYRSAPIGYLQQNDFVNAVAKIQTTLLPEALLSVMQNIEKQQGKNKLFKDGPRTLDLDILFFDNEKIETPELTVPHPRIYQRAFVLYPLQEVASERVTPEMLQAVSEQQLSVMEEIFT